VLKDGWLATGDVASMDENGFFSIIDRKENMVTRNNHRIFPRQIEEALYEHPAIAMAHVNREQGENGAVRLRAVVRLYSNLTATEDELKNHCAKRLSPNALPDAITIERPEEQGG
jgi:long-chain acyl-CoA synthetase